MSWIKEHQSFFEFLYFISSIGLLGTIIIGLIHLKAIKKDMRDNNRRAAVETSLKYLDFFATIFIPQSGEYSRNLKQEIPNPVNNEILFDGKFNLNISALSKEMIADCVIKQKFGAINLYNKLEYFSVGILNQLADEDIVFTPISRLYCDFIKKEHLLISVLRNQGAPYRNMIILFSKWEDRIEVEELELQNKENEHKIKEKGTGYKSSPPIGL